MIEPTQIVEETDNTLAISWSDGTDATYKAADLRRACPCATCVNEWTGEKILTDTDIGDDITFRSISIVGRYALNFQFSDNHETGIYSYRYLHGLFS